MNLKPLFAAGAFACASLVAATTANATVISVSDAGGQFETAPFSAYTVDAGAVDTAAFDTTSARFSFNGAGSGSEVFSFSSVAPVILTFGNLVESADFTTATYTIDDGVNPSFVVDLKATPDTQISVTVASPFTITTNFVDAGPGAGIPGVGSYDFTVTAPVPVPAGILMLGTALAGFGVMRRRKKAA